MIRQFWESLVELNFLTILCVLVVVGFMRLVYDLCSLIRRKRFAKKYLSKFDEFMDTGTYNPYKTEYHQWLLHNLTRIKSEMEGHKFADIYSLAFGDYPFEDANTLSDTLVNIARYSDRELKMTRSILDNYIDTLGIFISRKLWGLVNPFVWLRQVLRLIIFDAPFWSLQSVGVIRGNAENKIRYYAIVSKVIGVIIVLSTLFSLVRILTDIFGWVGLLR